VLDPPRIKPKQIRTAELIASDRRVQGVVPHLGRANKQADVLLYLLESRDPLPEETAVLHATNAKDEHLEKLAEAHLINRTPAQTTILPTSQEPPAELADLFAQLPSPLDQLTINHSRLTINHLIDSGHLETLEEPATLSLAIPPKQVLGHILQLRQATTYHDILRLLAREAQPVNLSDIYAETKATITHLRKLAKLDLIRFGSEEVWRDPLADRDFVPAEPPMLTTDQARVWGRIKMAVLHAEEVMEEGDEFTVDAPTPILLHGVTGSGKTEIYMRPLTMRLTKGQQAIVLVPEIALTPQTVRRFAARFPGRVAVLHSRLSDGERYDTWRRARQGLFDIVVGPRSALFTPLPNLGVIILDEEHDPSYKQTPPVPPPYYHTREAAIALAQIVGALVIMGSATPDIVTYHKAQSGRFHLLELQKRVMGHRQRLEGQAERLQLQNHYQHDGEDPDDALTIPLPPIQIVDLRQELRAGNRSIFSRALEKAITETLARGEQAILFLNRRGSATFVICRDCGYVATCPRCDLPLTYHQGSMMLVCHHCGRREPHQTECPQCQSKRIRYFGLGTEEVVQRVQQRWPEARITRWDRDTTAGRNTHETLLASFINQEADILVGTQMIAKGLDLPLVTLVGVISADVSLGLPDYRTGERAFQVLAQVAGRAGRGLLGGRVIIQTYKPEHYAIQAAAEHDFAAFYIDEIRFRTQHSLPPFRRMARLLYIDPVEERGQRRRRRWPKGCGCTSGKRRWPRRRFWGRCRRFLTG
jgi:primosomal protein N' (replication factor Y)